MNTTASLTNTSRILLLLGILTIQSLKIFSQTSSQSEVDLTPVEVMITPTDTHYVWRDDQAKQIGIYIQQRNQYKSQNVNLKKQVAHYMTLHANNQIELRETRKQKDHIGGLYLNEKAKYELCDVERQEVTIQRDRYFNKNQKKNKWLIIAISYGVLMTSIVIAK